MFLLLASACGSLGLTPSPDSSTPGAAAEEEPTVPAEETDEETSAEEEPPVEEEPAVEEEPPVEPPPDDPSLRGPWDVGVRTVTLWDDTRWRSIAVDVWYPMTPGDTSGTDNVYSLDILSLTVYEMATTARRDGAPASGEFAGVLFSHGYGGIRFQSYFLTEHLASHGFVVVAPDHPGNTLSEVWNLGSDEAAYQSSVDRPLDLSFALDALEDGSLGVRADATRVGITGHSFGGWASVQTPLVDDRIIASFPLAPGFKETSHPTDSAGLGIPFFVMGGSIDATCEFDENALATYEAAADPRYLVRVEGAGHLDFSNLCEIELAKLFIDDGCNSESIDPLTVQARVKTLGTTFAKVHIEGDARYAALLERSAVDSLGNLTYWRD